jgi:3,4-dihydroxy 2-butanone 4-phosphate synthase/GTP cyclohydrolase II
MVTIEAASGVTTGISARDRAHTIRVATDPDVGPADIVSPGHVIPIRAADDGLLTRDGYAEAAVDLVGLGGLGGAAVVCAVMAEDGASATAEEMPDFCARHGLAAVAIDRLAAFRLRRSGRGAGPGAQPRDDCGRRVSGTARWRVA